MSIAALAPIAPEHLKKVIEQSGYQTINQDDYNWVMARPEGLPLILPKHGEHVALEILMDVVFTKAGLDLRRYMALRDRTANRVN